MGEIKASHFAKDTKKNLEATLVELPQVVRRLLPEKNMNYYQNTNDMHCDLSKPGGSKFLEANNIFQVLQKDGLRITDMVEKRKDDREALIAAGASEQAFLPATKAPDAPEKLLEALYYKVDGVKGKLGVVSLKDLNPETKILIRREKSVLDEQGREKVPCSFSVFRETLEDMPDTDFATIIVGREGGKEGKDELWTIHPGMPIRPAQGDFIEGTETLPAPKEGEKQRVKFISVKDLLAAGKMREEDYVKIIQGNQEQAISQYEIIE